MGDGSIIADRNDENCTYESDRFEEVNSSIFFKNTSFELDIDLEHQTFKAKKEMTVYIQLKN